MVRGMGLTVHVEQVVDLVVQLAVLTTRGLTVFIVRGLAVLATRELAVFIVRVVGLVARLTLLVMHELAVLAGTVLTRLLQG